MQHQAMNESTSMAPLLLSSTRPKNDVLTFQHDEQRNDEHFRHITFQPDYLAAGSCLAGNALNCAVSRALDVDKESRIGTITNLNTVQRDTTTHPVLGLQTTPDLTSGPLVDRRLINDMSILEGRFENNTRLVIPPSSLLNDRYEREPRPPALADVVDPRSVSTRVSRRNSFAATCVRKEGLARWP